MTLGEYFAVIPLDKRIWPSARKVKPRHLRRVTGLHFSRLSRITQLSCRKRLSIQAENCKP